MIGKGDWISDIKDTFSVSIKEGKLLFRLAKESKEAIVEIGSWKGYSTTWLAAGSKAGNRAVVYAVDTFGGDIHKFVSGEGSTYEAFIRNITTKNVDDIITPMVMTSEDAEKSWEGTRIGLLFIDGDHDDIEADFGRWYPHLGYGGIIALHDTVAWPSMLPYRIAIREIYTSGKFTGIRRTGSITYARKVIRLHRGDRIRNRIALCTRYVYQAFIPYYTRLLVLADKCRKKITNHGNVASPVYSKTGMTQWHWRVSHRENFKLGRNTEIGSFTMIDARYGVTIEDDVKIGFGCSILSNSTIDDKQGRIVLKKGCAVGAGSVIAPNVTIGEKAIVGANSFVNHDIPPNEVWFGTPAKFCKRCMND